MYEHEKLGLPRYYVVDKSGDGDAVEAFRRISQIHNADWHELTTLHYNFFGFDCVNWRGGTVLSNNLSAFKNNPTILTPTEFLNIINKKTMKHQLKEKDTLANVTAEQWEVIKAIAKHNDIPIYPPRIEDGFPDSGHPHLTYNMELAGNCTREGDNARKWLSFETFIAKMLGTYKDPNIEVVLNDSYTAIVSKDSVKVGCQTFSHEKIKELYEATQKVK
jgi:hypothetical protein